MSENAQTSEQSAAYEWKKLGGASSGNYWTNKATSPVEEQPASELGFEQGHAEGLEQGRAEGLAEYSAAVKMLASALDSVELERTQSMNDTQAALKTMVCDLFETLFTYELQHSAAFLNAVCEAAEGLLSLDAPAQIKMHPQDHALLQSHADAAAPEFMQRTKASADVQAGTLRLESNSVTNEIDVVSRLREVLSSAELASFEEPGASSE